MTRMTRTVLNRAVQMMRDDGRDGITLYEDYSGRGMYGRRTSGFVGPLSVLLEIGPYLMHAWVAQTIETEGAGGADPLDIDELMERARDQVREMLPNTWDSMARDMIVYWSRGIQEDTDERLSLRDDEEEDDGW